MSEGTNEQGGAQPGQPHGQPLDGQPSAGQEQQRPSWDETAREHGRHGSPDATPPAYGSPGVPGQPGMPGAPGQPYGPAYPYTSPSGPNWQGTRPAPGGYGYGPTPAYRSQSRPPKRQGGLIAGVVAGVVVLAMILVAAVVGLGGLLFVGQPESNEVQQSSPEITAPIERPDGSVAAIAAEVLASTVYIESVMAQGVASGTGVVFSEDGYIVTNAHVISGADGPGGQITVTFQDGGTYTAEVVGSSESYDLAVLRVERSGLVPLTLADSDQVVVGDPVISVGAPLGLQGTVTTGIVSALNRAVTAGSADEVSFINAIQTDAAINPGNSGGPLVNMNGEVIGINSAIAQAPGSSQATGSIGLGFAIPSNQVARTANELIENGYATYPIIGILLDGSYSGEGVLVSERTLEDGTPAVTPGGPGDEAGVRPGDVILRIDSRPVTSPDEVIVTVRSHAPGDTVVLTIRRGDQELEIPVTLAEQRAN